MRSSALALAAVFAFVLSSRALGQYRSYNPFVTWVHLVDNEEVVKGSLLEVRDSSVVIITHVKTLAGELPGHRIEYAADRIATIEVRRRSSVLTGAGIGLLSGVTLGILIGVLSTDPDQNAIEGMAEATLGAFVYGTLMGAIGTGLGAVFGAIRRSFPIYGSAEQFRLYRDKLLRAAVPAG